MSSSYSFTNSSLYTSPNSLFYTSTISSSCTSTNTSSCRPTSTISSEHLRILRLSHPPILQFLHLVIYLCPNPQIDSSTTSAKSVHKNCPKRQNIPVRQRSEMNYVKNSMSGYEFVIHVLFPGSKRNFASITLSSNSEAGSNRHQTVKPRTCYPPSCLDSRTLPKSRPPPRRFFLSPPPPHHARPSNPWRLRTESPVSRCAQLLIFSQFPFGKLVIRLCFRGG